MILLEKFELETLCTMHGHPAMKVLCDVLRRQASESQKGLVNADSDVDLRRLQGRAGAFIELLESLETVHDQIDAAKRNEAQQGETPF